MDLWCAADMVDEVKAPPVAAMAVVEAKVLRAVRRVMGLDTVLSKTRIQAADQTGVGSVTKTIKSRARLAPARRYLGRTTSEGCLATGRNLEMQRARNRKSGVKPDPPRNGADIATWVGLYAQWFHPIGSCKTVSPYRPCWTGVPFSWALTVLNRQGGGGESVKRQRPRR